MASMRFSVAHVSTLQRIRRETVIWMAANHPNILQFIGYQICEGKPWLVSPWCQLGNLSRYIAENPKIKRVEKLKLASITHLFVLR